MLATRSNRLADKQLTLLRPARKDEPDPGGFPAWLRQRVDHLDAQAPARPGPARRPHPLGLWVRVVQRLLALNAVIWFNWQLGAPVKRSLIAYDH